MRDRLLVGLAQATRRKPGSWLPEAARVLRPGGRLVFLTHSLLMALCMPVEGPASHRLQRAQRGLRRLEWPGEDGVEFHLAHGEWIDLLRGAGLSIEGLRELYAPAHAKPTSYEWATAAWADRWPYEEIWIARKS